MENDVDNATERQATIISSLRSPMSVFGLSMLICNAVFSTSAAIMNNLEVFIYSIHTFLAIVFFVHDYRDQEPKSALPSRRLNRA